MRNTLLIAAALTLLSACSRSSIPGNIDAPVVAAPVLDQPATTAPARAAPVMRCAPEGGVARAGTTQLAACAAPASTGAQS